MNIINLECGYWHDPYWGETCMLYIQRHRSAMFWVYYSRRSP